MKDVFNNKYDIYVYMISLYYGNFNGRVKWIIILSNKAKVRDFIVADF